jgi:hypothetical protein
MERVNIILPTRPKADISDKDWILFDKEQFRNMVFQAYYYPNTSLTINNVTVANRDVKIAICGKVKGGCGAGGECAVIEGGTLAHGQHYPAGILCIEPDASQK